jgi:hypothetical protein
MASDCICPLLMLDFSRLLVNTSQVLPVQPCPCQTRRSERWLLSLMINIAGNFLLSECSCPNNPLEVYEIGKRPRRSLWLDSWHH